jgi:hypothetical protein
MERREKAHIARAAQQGGSQIVPRPMCRPAGPSRASSDLPAPRRSRLNKTEHAGSKCHLTSITGAAARSALNARTVARPLPNPAHQARHDGRDRAFVLPARTSAAGHEVTLPPEYVRVDYVALCERYLSILTSATSITAAAVYCLRAKTFVLAAA